MQNTFFKRKDGTDYLVSKEEIYNYINVYDPRTFIDYLEDLDLPWIPRIWADYIEMSIKHNHSIESTFGKYYQRMKMASFKDFGFKDSYRFFKL